MARTKLSPAQVEADRIARAAGMCRGQDRLIFMLGVLEGLRSVQSLDMGHQADLLVTVERAVRELTKVREDARKLERGEDI